MKIKSDEELTVLLRLKLCLEILTKRSVDNKKSKVSSLSVFQCGYSSGFFDAMPKIKTKPIFRNDVI